MFYQQKTLNCNGKLISIEQPLVMGILNVTPDSFFDGGKYQNEKAVLDRAEQILNEGGNIIDVGGMSSRPNAEIIDVDEELQRVIPVIEKLSTTFPEAIISIDTVQSEVANRACEAGASMINDISGGNIDNAIFDAAIKNKVPYILMHIQGTPKNMQDNPKYENVVLEILDYFIEKIGKLREKEMIDIIVDPGFGFGKSIDHNYQILKKLHIFKMLEVPIMVGLSRKSMIYKVLETDAQNALNGTTALHMIALQQGARLLRVHDVKEAVETVKLWNQIDSMNSSQQNN